MTLPKRPPDRKRSLLVKDRAGLAQYVHRIVVKYGGHTIRAGIKKPNTLAASRIIKISQSQLWRMLNQQSGTIRTNTLRKLTKLWPEDEQDILGKAFLDRRTHVVLNGYNVWVAGARKHIALGVGRGWEKAATGLVQRPRQSNASKIKERRRQLDALRKRMHTKYPNTYKKFVERLQKLDSVKTNPERIALAVDRILAPLLDSAESAFIERDWESIPPRELGIFIRAGMRRELILLRRAAEAQQAREVVLDL